MRGLSMASGWVFVARYREGCGLFSRIGGNVAGFAGNRKRVHGKASAGQTNAAHPGILKLALIGMTASAPERSTRSTIAWLS